MMLLLLLCLWSQHPAEPEQPLTNAAIVELTRAGVSDQAVMQLIDSRDSAFDVSVPGLIALKRSGVRDALIRSMLTASARGGGVARPRLPSTMPDEQGVYWEREEGLQRLPIEDVTLRGPRGFETDTGAIRGPRSGLVLVPPVTFVVRTAPEVTADEYILVQLFTRDDRREFRTLMGGLWRGDGIERMAVPFESERLAPNVFRLRVIALPKGEFGFLRPGTPLPAAAGVTLPDSPSGSPIPDPLTQGGSGQTPPPVPARGDDRSAQEGHRASHYSATIFTFGVH